MHRPKTGAVLPEGSLGTQFPEGGKTGSEREAGVRRGKHRWPEGNPYAVQSLFRAVEVGGGKRKREKVRPDRFGRKPGSGNERIHEKKQKKTRQREAVGPFLCGRLKSELRLRAAGRR